MELGLHAPAVLEGRTMAHGAGCGGLEHTAPDSAMLPFLEGQRGQAGGGRVGPEALEPGDACWGSDQLLGALGTSRA